ncbi:MAG: hypothetical protein Ta2F_16620 [Termitinemataceae bacterium]|nr:MAG: hypothetical protein Ta2F_16620 [Termitinemataceae bacterium]
MKITNKNTLRRVAGIFSIMLIFGFLFIGCGEYKPDIGAWIDEQIAKARETTEEVPANPEPEPDPTSPDPTSPEPSPEPTAITEVTEAADSQEMKSALETHAEELELDLTLYDILSDDVKDEAAQIIFENGPYADKEAIQTAFNDALQVAVEEEKNISKKFKITPEDSTEKALVKASFNAVHTYIENTFAVDTTEAMSVIKLGDYIDLSPLSVVGDAGHTTDPTYGYINAKRDLRLIVIGINSFNGKNGNYTPHVVFHFEKVPGKHKMNDIYYNTTGYLDSKIRGYILDNFLPGLKNAGVPNDVLWSPSRRVASSGVGSAVPQTITDKLWLPTEWEMIGTTRYSVASCENAGNQVSFTGYYKGDTERIKNSEWYWSASPNSDTFPLCFCYVGSDGSASFGGADTVGGCVPAFCVK